MQNTNDPADLQPHGGLRNNDNMAAHHAHGPFIPNNDMMKDFPAPMVSCDGDMTRRTR